MQSWWMQSWWMQSWWMQSYGGCSHMVDAVMVGAVMVDAVMVDAVMVDAVMVDAVMVDAVMVDAVIVECTHPHLEPHRCLETESPSTGSSASRCLQQQCQPLPPSTPYPSHSTVLRNSAVVLQLLTFPHQT